MSGSCEYSFDCEIFAPLKKRPVTPSSSGEEARYATACAAWSGDRDASPTTSRAGAASSRIRRDFMKPRGTTFAKTLVPSRRRARGDVHSRSAIFDAPNAWSGRQFALICRASESSSAVVLAAAGITCEGRPGRTISLVEALPTAPLAPCPKTARPPELPVAPAMRRGGEPAINIPFAVCEAGPQSPQLYPTNEAVLRAGLSEEALGTATV